MLPGILRDVLERILTEDDELDVRGYIAEPDKVVATMLAEDVSVVIIGASDERLPPLGKRLLDRLGELKLFLIQSDGRRAFLHELHPTRTPLGEVSPKRLVEAIKGTAGKRGTGDAENIC